MIQHIPPTPPPFQNQGPENANVPPQLQGALNTIDQDLDDVGKLLYQNPPDQTQLSNDLNKLQDDWNQLTNQVNQNPTLKNDTQFMSSFGLLSDEFSDSLKQMSSPDEDMNTLWGNFSELTGTFGTVNGYITGIFGS